MAGLSAGQAAALERFRARLSQGDVVHIQAFAVLGAPAATLLGDTHEAEEVAPYGITAVERRLDSGLWAIVTQTCDIRREIEVEPFLQLAPLVDASETGWERARDGASSTRRFAFPRPIEDCRNPVLDIRIVQTIEKTALVADGVDPIEIGMDRAQRLRLSVWLSRRYARHAFPDEVEDSALRRLREEIAKRLGQTGTPAGALLACREAVMVRYGEGPVIDVLFIVRQDKIAAQPAFQKDPESQIKQGADSIMKPVARHLERVGGGYQLTWDVATPNLIPYDEILYRYNPLDIDLP